jgi:2-polyprenyl-6-methoxyphenol hydroxylase and related FAD-dependent oxidoreductases
MIINTPQNNYDIVIVGGGMVGATFAVTMSETTSKSNLTILVVEATSTSTKDSTESNFDSRSTALSFGSKEILGESSIWLDLCKNAEAIRSINVSDKGRLGTTTISSEEQNVEALGFVIENEDLRLTLQNRLTASPKIHFLISANILGVTPKASGMSLRVGSGESDWIVTSSLLVLADGGRSSVCRDLGISNINSRLQPACYSLHVAFEKAQEGVAFKRFTDTGPLTVITPSANLK